MARAAKYEQDAQAAKLAGSIEGVKKIDKRLGVAAGGGSKRPPPAAFAAHPASDAAPLRGEEVAEAVKVLRSIAARPGLLLDKASKPLRVALHPLVEAHMLEVSSSPTFRLTCMLGQRHRWDGAAKLLSELRAQPPARRPKLGTYQRWVKELGVADGDASELAMLDAIMRVAAGFQPPQGAPPTAGGSVKMFPPFVASEQTRVLEPVLLGDEGAPRETSASAPDVTGVDDQAPTFSDRLSPEGGGGALPAASAMPKDAGGDGDQVHQADEAAATASDASDDGDQAEAEPAPGASKPPPTAQAPPRKPRTLREKLSALVHARRAEAVEKEAARQAGATAACGDGNEERPMSVISKLSNMIQARQAEAADDRYAAAIAVTPEKFFVVAHEAAHDRSPPNHFDLDIYMARDPITLSLRSPPPLPVAAHSVTGVEGAMVLSDVLSASECSDLRTASEMLGYRQDVPLSFALDGRSAHNVVFMATEAQNDALFERVRRVLPTTLGGSVLLGLNRRWRLYRYQAGSLFRKHLDSAWPASGLRTNEGRTEYVYDAYGSNVRSRLAFFVYLNDDFEGGATTFYVPQRDVEGTLEGRPVKPRTGYAAVFPHGNTGVPLLFEDSAVTTGTKYLLRTDVVYEGSQSVAAQREAVRLRGVARSLGLDIADVAPWVDGAPEKAGAEKAKGAKTKAKKRAGKHDKLKESSGKAPKFGRRVGPRGAEPQGGAADLKRVKKSKKNSAGKRAQKGSKRQPAK